MASKPHYGAQTVYGPFHRLESPTQATAAMHHIARSGELWGTASAHTDVPRVKAYNGPLPQANRGFEFYTLAPPDQPYGGTMFWGERTDATVSLEDEWARIVVLVSRISQDL